MNAATRSRTARRRLPARGDLRDAADRPFRLVTTNDGAPTTKRSRPQDDRAVIFRKASKKPKLFEGPLGDELGTKKLDGDGAVLGEYQMRHRRAVHAHDDVGLRDLAHGRPRGVRRAPITTSIKRRVAGSKERPRERLVVGEGSVTRVVACVESTSVSGGEEADAPRTVLFGPCDHLVACASCAAALAECPNCRAKITTRTTIANSS
jgi:hypothetical protein